jgi:hypothetical protein
MLSVGLEYLAEGPTSQDCCCYNICTETETHWYHSDFVSSSNEIAELKLKKRM